MSAVFEPASKMSAMAAPEIIEPEVEPRNALPDWDQLARRVSSDLQRISAQIVALSDSTGCGPDPLPSISTLLEETNRHLCEIRASIDVRPLTKTATDEAYTTMFKPLAFVEGAIAMAVKVEADIISPVLRVVHELLNEAQDSLGDQALGAMLPCALSADQDHAPQQDPIQVAFGQVEDLLNHAQGTEEDHSWSGDSERLIRIAHGLADEAALRPPKGVEIDRVAYDIAALIRACRLVPGDTESKERTALLTQVEQHLRSITECLEDCCDPGAPRPPATGEAAEESALKTEMRECARTACYEIQCLAEAMQIVAEKFGSSEDQPVAHGIMARIIVLAEIVYHAAQLHGEAPMATLAELRNSFKGRL